MESKLILIANDDGIEADGIGYLRNAVKVFGDVVVVAPLKEMSASSHAVTLKKPIYIKEISRDTFGISGTPADSVIIALFHLLKRQPDYVLSGINLGQNLGEDVFYSGTVAAAREGAIYGIKSAAFSLVVKNGDTEIHFDSATIITKMVVENLLNKLPQGVLLNINIPNAPFKEIKGIKITKLSTRRYKDIIKEEGDYVIIGGHPIWQIEEGTDVVAVMDGYVSITPLLIDLTNYEEKKELERIIREID